jgi:hypothetical protein
MKKIFLSLILSVLPFSLSASELTIHKTLTGYSFSSDEIDVEVPYYMMSKQVRSISPDKLAAILNSGNAYLDFKECSDGSYAVDIQGRIKGGGPITAGILYWTTKIGCYGTAAAAMATIATARAGTGLAGAGGVVAHVAGGAVAAGAGIGAPIAGVVGAGIANVAAAEAAVVTAGVVTSAGGVASAVTAVETASLGAFAFGMMLPLP